MPVFYYAGCKFLWLAHLSKGEENGGDASVGQVTGRWIQKHRTLVLRPIAFDRTRPVMLGSLLETTGR